MSYEGWLAKVAAKMTELSGKTVTVNSIRSVKSERELLRRYNAGDSAELAAVALYME